MKKPIKQNESQRMSRADIAIYYDRSLPWVDRAHKIGLIPPPIRIGAPIWFLPEVKAWQERLSQEAISNAQTELLTKDECTASTTP